MKNIHILKIVLLFLLCLDVSAMNRVDEANGLEQNRIDRGEIVPEGRDAHRRRVARINGEEDPFVRGIIDRLYELNELPNENIGRRRRENVDQEVQTENANHETTEGSGRGFFGSLCLMLTGAGLGIGGLIASGKVVIVSLAFL